MDIEPAKPTASPVAQLAELVYELLDAHDDTARLAREQLDDARWAAHLDYLRSLQRVARESLARTQTPRVVVPAARALGSDTGELPN